MPRYWVHDLGKMHSLRGLGSASLGCMVLTFGSVSELLAGCIDVDGRYRIFG